MPKPTIVESRLDFSGGLNVSAPIDTLNTNELRETTNVRVEPHGGLIRRLGSRKLNSVALPDSVMGIYQWTGFFPTGELKIAAVSSDRLWVASPPYDTFSVAAAGQTLLDVPNLAVDFTTFKDSSFGTFREVLYIDVSADNDVSGRVFRFDGSNFAQVTNAAYSIPFGLRSIRSFGSRLFATDGRYLYWSKLGNGSDFSTGGVADGGFNAMSDNINSLEVVGSSLLLGGDNSVARFTGIGADIQILSDTFGVSADVGPIALGSFSRADQFAVFASDRGPYVVTEGGIIFIGEKIITTSPSPITMLPDLNPLIAHNRRRKEIWFAYVPLDSGFPVSRTSILVYNYHTQCWYGRFKYPFSITSLGRYQDVNGVEGIMAGCSDGFIRILDDVSAGSLDDDGFDYEATVQFAPFGLEAGPYILKAVKHIFLQTVGAASHTVNIIGDLGDSEVATLIE